MSHFENHYGAPVGGRGGGVARGCELPLVDASHQFYDPVR